MLKKIKILLLLLIAGIAVKAQYPSPIFTKPNNSYGTIANGGSFDSSLYGPTGCGAPTDTTFLRAQQNGGKAQKLRKWAQYYDSCGHHAWNWDPSLQAWHIADSSSGGGTTYTADETTIHLAANQFSIKSTYPGQSSIGTVGTILSGIWQSTPIADAFIASSAAWNAKLTSVLTSANIFVGNGSNIATAVTPSGDWTINNAGVNALASIITAGSCTNCNLTYDAKGRVTVAANGTGGGSGAPFNDNVALIQNNADNTRKVILDASLVATGTTRTFKVPNVNGTAATIDNAQTFAPIETFTLAPILTALTGYLFAHGSSAVTASTTIPTTDLSGTLAAAQEPAHIGDVTNTAGSLAMTLANTAVTPGSYTNPNITVDSKGRITAASNSTATDTTKISHRGPVWGIYPSAAGDSIIDKGWNNTPSDAYVRTGADSANYIILKQKIAAGSCTNCNISYDSAGRVIMAANGTGGGSSSPYPLDSVLRVGPISGRNMQVAGIKSTGQDTLTATTYSEGYDRVIVQDTATGAGNGKLYRRKMQTIDMTGAVDGAQPYYSNSAGNFKLAIPSIDNRGDSQTIANITMAIEPNLKNSGWTGLNHMRNLQAVMALTQDTINYSAFADSAQLRLNIMGHSMFERNNLFEQHYIQYMSSKGFHSVGPGFISMSGQKFGINWVVPVAEWTTLSLFTGTVGTGPDGYELVSTGATADSIVIQPQTAYKFSDWMQGTVVELWWRGGSGYGSFRLVIDGTNYGTINTASSSGINRTIIRNLPYSFHVVSIAPISEGTNHIHLLGMFEYQSGTRGWLINKVAKGSSTVTQWLGLNASEWQTMIGWMKPTTCFMDWVVTSMNTSDSADYVVKMDSVFRRLRAVDTTIDRVVFGPTIFSQGGSYVIISPWASYGRALKRMAQDSLITYWDPSSLLGTNVILAMKRGMVDPDSLHRSPQFSEAEVAQILSSIGMISYIPSPTAANFYAQDGTMTIPAGVREVFMDGANNTNGTSLRFHDLNKFYMLGKGANPGLTWDFSNSLQVALTGGVQIVGDMDIKTSQTFAASYALAAKSLYSGTLGNITGAGGVDIGGGGSSGGTQTGVFIHPNAPTGLQQIFENTNTTSGYSIIINKVDGSTATAAYRFLAGSGIWDMLLDGTDSKKFKFYNGNGFSTGTLVYTINPTTSNTNFGSATDVPTSLFSITSTTKGSIPAPIMTATQMNAISSPATGLMVFNSTAGEYYRYNGSAWAAVGGGLTNPMTTAGDIIVGGASGVPARLAIGSNGTFPVVSSGALAYTTALPSGTTATTQTANDNSTKVSTTAYADNAVGNKFTATASASTITNTTVSTTVVGTGVGSLTLPANSLQVGQIITLQGAVNVSSYASGNISFGGVIGGNTSGALIVVSSGAFSNMGVYVTIRFTVTAIGSSGSVSPVVTLLGGGDWGPTQPVIVLGSAITVNTTGTLVLDAVGAFSVASSSNSMNGVPGWRATVN